MRVRTHQYLCDQALHSVARRHGYVGQALEGHTASYAVTAGYVMRLINKGCALEMLCLLNYPPSFSGKELREISHGFNGIENP